MRNITNTKSQQKANIGIGWNKTYKELSRFFNGWFNLSNICGAPQILEIVVFMDMSAVSEPILIKQMILSFKLYVLSNMTLSFSLSHKKIILYSALCNKTQLSL